MQEELGKKSESKMGFEPTTLLDLVGCSNHWATGDCGAQESICGFWLEPHRAAVNTWFKINETVGSEKLSRY